MYHPQDNQSKPANVRARGESGKSTQVAISGEIKMPEVSPFLLHATTNTAAPHNSCQSVRCISPLAASSSHSRAAISLLLGCGVTPAQIAEHNEEEKEPEAPEAAEPEEEAGGQKGGKQHVDEIVLRSKVQLPPAEDGVKTADIDSAKVGSLLRIMPCPVPRPDFLIRVPPTNRAFLPPSSIVLNCTAGESCYPRPNVVHRP